MTTAPLFVAVFHYLVCSLGTIFYAVLLVAIITHTPVSLRCYAVTLFAQTILLMLTCITSGVHFARVIPNGFSTFVISSGPVHYLQSAQIGFYFECFLLHGHSHYCTMLAECFIHRYYVFIRPPPSLRPILSLLVLVYLPTAVIFTWTASSATLLDEATAKIVIAPRGPQYVFDDAVLVVGILDVREPCNLSAIFLVCVLWIPCYGVCAFHIMLASGWLMYRILAAHLTQMSEKTRSLHRDIVRGLVVQACLPVLYGISALMFAIGQYNNRSLVEFEYCTHMAGELCLMLTPLTTLYFVQPYRQAIANLLHHTKITPQFNSSSYTTAIVDHFVN